MEDDGRMTWQVRCSCGSNEWEEHSDLDWTKLFDWQKKHLKEHSYEVGWPVFTWENL